MTVDDYLSSAHQRTIRVRVFDEAFDPNREAVETFEVTFDGDLIADRNELPRTAASFLMGHDHYSISDSSSIVEAGASGGTQEVLIEITGGLGATFIVYLIAQARTWLSKAPAPADEPATDAECIDRLRDMIDRDYRPTAPLRLHEHSGTDDALTAKFVDGRSVHYEASMDRRTSLTQIRRSTR